MSQQQTAKPIETKQSLPEPAIAACNFLEVLDFPGRVLARRFVVDPSIPKLPSDRPRTNMYVNCGPQGSLDVDVWVRSVDDQDFAPASRYHDTTELNFSAGRDARVRIHTMGNQPFYLGVIIGKGRSAHLRIPRAFRGLISFPLPKAIVDLSPLVCEYLIVDTQVSPKDMFTFTIRDNADTSNVLKHRCATKVWDSVLIMAPGGHKSISIAFIEEDWTPPEVEAAPSPDPSWWPLQWLSGWYNGA